MKKGMNRSITGLMLSAFAGATLAPPGLAQSPLAQPTSAPTPTPTPVPTLLDQPRLLEPSPAPALPGAASATPIESAYTLGAGDLVKIDIFNTPELVLEPRYTVLLDGSVNLPWIGSVSVQGLTLQQASQMISERYNRFIRNPIITVSIVAPRPLKIGVIGEINRPGSYIISVISNESSIASISQRSGAEGGSQWPTVSKAIQTAGGITLQANVRQIQVRRPTRTGEENINVDLWKFLKEGDLAQDIILRDGDTIVIPTATTLDAAETTQVAVSNFSPAEIKVNVVGEVEEPGTVTIRPNSTLNQAILAAGGFRSKRADRDVELIRLQPNGTVSKRQIKVDLSKNLDEASNPALRDNDIVVVRRNTITNVVDTLGIILTPLTSGVFGILRTLGVGIGN
jgi:polysaccharide export outer membrane protein